MIEGYDLPGSCALTGECEEAVARSDVQNSQAGEIGKLDLLQQSARIVASVRRDSAGKMKRMMPMRHRLHETANLCSVHGPAAAPLDQPDLCCHRINRGSADEDRSTFGP